MGYALVLGRVVEVARELGDLKVIYDHQKGGTDIPQPLGEEFADVMAEAGVDAAILLPFGGSVTLPTWVKVLNEVNIPIIVGGYMNQDGFLVSQGEYIADEAPERIYRTGCTAWG